MPEGEPTRGAILEKAIQLVSDCYKSGHLETYDADKITRYIEEGTYKGLVLAGLATYRSTFQRGEGRQALGYDLRDLADELKAIDFPESLSPTEKTQVRRRRKKSPQD